MENAVAYFFYIKLYKKTEQQSTVPFPDEPGGIRTPDPRLRRPLLYPTELLIHIEAGDENRTHVFSLEG